jgi:cell division septum initiation protein DivIVA
VRASHALAVAFESARAGAATPPSRGPAGSTIELVAKDTSTRAGSATGQRGRRPNGSSAAERQATALIDAARRDADRIRRDAEKDAKRTREEAEDHARRLVLDARATADGVRAEGMEVVSNLREMGASLRSNAERLLHDIQSIHARMVGELGEVAPADEDGAEAAAPEPSPGGHDRAAGTDEVLDVPDFVSRG